MNYSWRIGAYKAFRNFLVTVLAVAAIAVATYLSIPENLALLLGFLPDTVEKALIPPVAALFVFASNWLKERNKPSQDKYGNY